MLFLLEWKIKDSCTDKALNRLINSNNNIENGKLIEKFHAHGSIFGWILAESDNISNINKYISEESEFLDWSLTPILKDNEAIMGLSYVMKSKKN